MTYTHLSNRALMRSILSAGILFVGGLTTAGTARADLHIVTDIAPVQSIATRLMRGQGAASVLVPAKASPHSYALRPSQARQLANADVVIWMGPELTPWLGETIETLAPTAAHIELLRSAGLAPLPFRDTALFGAAAHEEHEEGAHEEGEHGDHKDHEDHENHDDHSDDHGDDHDGHNHAPGAMDPHAWLDPQSAMIWADVIAQELIKIDPANADVYGQNAREFQAELQALQVEIAGIIGPVKSQRFMVLHDSFQYFERATGVAAVGAISLGDGSAPGPARFAQLRDLLAENPVECVFSEPQFSPKLVNRLLENTDIATAVLDPLGQGIAAGPDAYADLLRDVATDIAGCLAR